MRALPPRANANGYADLATKMRHWIVDADIAPGALLPKQQELAARFEVSNLTAGRAMRELQDDGFITAKRGTGSFVSPVPPHLYHYGLIFSLSESEVLENRFLLALTREAVRLSEESDLTIRCYYGITGSTKEADWNRLNQDLQRRRLAGLIFSTPPHLLLGEPVLDLPGFRRVAIMEDLTDFPELTKVGFRPKEFTHRALRRLADMGCGRVGAIVNSAQLDCWYDQLRQFAPQYGLETRPHWLQGCPLEIPGCARHATQLLMSLPPESRPDALIIADDNLVEEATRGIVAARTDGSEIAVIAHCNFPWLPPASVPVQHLGIDAGEMLTACLKAVRCPPSEAAKGSLSYVETIFQDEYAARRRRQATAAPELSGTP